MAHTTSTHVRNLLPDLLISEDIIGTHASGTYLLLTNPAFGVPTILKDTTILTLTTDYTFVQPREITLGTPAAGEHFTATVYIAFSDTELDAFIATSDRVVDNFFVNLTTPGSGYLQDWSTYLAAALVLRSKAKGDEDMLKWADSLEKIVMGGMQAYKDGTSAGVYDDAGVTRDDATSVPDFKLDQGGIPSYEDDN